MTPTDLDRLDLRRDLFEVRRAVAEQLAAGQDCAPLLRALGERDKVALGEVMVGPQAAKGTAAVAAALSVVDLLETAVAPAGLYRRLADLAPESGRLVLAAAAARHGLANWVLLLSQRVEGPDAGATHLVALAAHEGFENLCWSYAAAGHRRGLILAAERTGRCEPVAALLAAGALDDAALAAVRALETAPDAPVLPWLAAIWGPDLDGLLCRTLPHLRSRAVADILWAGAAPFPTLMLRLAAIRRAMT